MTDPPYNCSSSSSSAIYAYSPSQSPADALQLCARLLNAKCSNLGLDAAYCSSSQSAATGEKVLAMYAASFCSNYFGIVDSALALVSAAPIFVAFVVNCIFRLIRAARGPCAPKLVKSDRELRMVDPLAEISMSIPSGSAAQRQKHGDALGLFGELLPYFGMHWMRAPKTSCSRQVLRIAFLSWTIFVMIPLCIEYQRLYLARFDPLSFLATFNQCSSLCLASGITTCSQPVQVTFNCMNLHQSPSLMNYLECLAEGKVQYLVQAGLAVQVLLLLLPLHSALSCAHLWSRPDNPIMLTLHALRQLSPDRHRQCCVSTMKFIAVLTFVLTTLSVLCSQIYNTAYTSSCYNALCPSLNVKLVLPKLICQILVYAFLCLTPVAMVALFAFTAYIVRDRMRAFVCLAQFVGSSMLPVHADPQVSGPLRYFQTAIGSEQVLTALHICRCPHSILSKCRAQLLSDGKNSYSSAAAELQPHLRMLWTIQLRDVQLLAKFADKWLLVQTVFALSFLLPVAAFLSLASQYSALLVVVLPILQLYSLFCVPFIAAILALAIGNFYVNHACDKLSNLLLCCSEASEGNADAFGSAFSGQDSLSSIITFCRLTSQDAFELYGMQINWISLARFVYYMGLLVWVLSTSLMGLLSVASLRVS